MTTATKAAPVVNSKRFEGKVVVVTGGNSGIGLAAARAYAQEGAQVAILGRNEETLQAATEEIPSAHLALAAHYERLGHAPEAERERRAYTVTSNSLLATPK